MLGRIESIVFIWAAVIGAVAIFIFAKFAENSELMFRTASILLITALLLIQWIQYFSQIKPFRLSMILTAITVISIALSLFLLNRSKVESPYSTLIGIGIGKKAGSILAEKSILIGNIVDKLLSKKLIN